MYRFSIIVPVYNVEKYIDKCLTSLVNQKFNNYEIIVINDGSTDSSKQIIEKFVDKYNFIKLIDKSNTGLSDTRNVGVSLATGDYLLFVDSDDYIDTNLLMNLDKIIGKKEYELIKFQYELVYSDYTKIMKDDIGMNKSYLGSDLFIQLSSQRKQFETACCYVYKRSFWLDNNFLYESGRYHEDFGLTPYIILKAKNIYVSDLIGYYYNQESSSIMRNNDYEKTFKKAYDILYHFDNLYQRVKNDNEISSFSKKYFYSYIANAVINKVDTLNKKDRKRYIHEIKRKKILNLLLDDSISRKVKKIFYKIKFY